MTSRMRLVLTLAGSMLVATSVIAAELPITGAYGTPAGCAIETGDKTATDGESTLFTTKQLRFEGAICNYTAVADATAGWEAKIRCASGHDEEVPGTLNISEADGTLTVELASGKGPEGEFPACTK